LHLKILRPRALFCLNKLQPQIQIPNACPLKNNTYLFCAFLVSLFFVVLVEAFFVTLEADGDGDGDGVTLGSGSGSSSSGGCSNASDFDDEGTGLGTEVFDSETGKGGGGGVTAWACWAATRSGLMRGFLVEVPFRTSHIEHLKASALFLKVQTLQSQVPSSASEAALAFAEVRFRLKYVWVSNIKLHFQV
jgi:hypothetical protein